MHKNYKKRKNTCQNTIHINSIFMLSWRIYERKGLNLLHKDTVKRDSCSRKRWIVEKCPNWNSPTGIVIPPSMCRNKYPKISWSRKFSPMNYLFQRYIQNQILPPTPPQTPQFPNGISGSDQKRLSERTASFELNLPKGGIEPPWSCPRRILSPLRLPISPLRH